VAMGGLLDRTGSLHPMIDTLAGGAWRARFAPVQGLAVGARGPQWLYVTSLACPAPGACLATGWYYATASAGEVHGFLLTEAGGRWAPGALPVAGLDPPPGRALDVVPWAVACRAPGSCTVVGSYDDEAGDTYGFADALAAGHWRAAAVRVGGLEPAAARNPAMVLGAVSCPAAGPCMALGTYADASGAAQGLLVRGPG